MNDHVTHVNKKCSFDELKRLPSKTCSTLFFMFKSLLYWYQPHCSLEIGIAMGHISVAIYHIPSFSTIHLTDVISLTSPAV